MKKFFTFLTCTFIAASAFASDITIAFNGNNGYQVVIDGRNISNYNSRTSVINLNNFQPGQHSIAVYRMKNNRGWDNNKLVYSSYFTVRPQYDLFINIAGNGRVSMNERKNAYDDYSRNRGDRNNGYGRDKSRNDDYDDRGYRNHEDRNYGYGNKGYGNDNNWSHNNNRYNNAMSDYNFNQLVQRIRGQWFGKFNTTKEAVTNNYLTAYQVKQLLQLFSSDSERLELAKQAYRNTVDQRNYTQWYDLLSRRSQNELNRSIRDYRY